MATSAPGGAPVDVPALVDGVLAGDRRATARAITLVESTRGDHRDAAQELLGALLPHAGRARRVGISGVPGVGKSTFIDTLGTTLTAAGSRVAVLAVDPSSTRSGGSILGDKTRMSRLAVDPRAFIRPAPTAGTLGGVAQATRESMVVVEAAGHDVVLVETVGVGQSEVTVAEMVDTFLFLTLARTGDQLQGIKRGILEIADVIAVNKADGPGEADARRAARELAGAVRMLRGATDSVPVLTCAGLTGAGVPEVWAALVDHADRLRGSGALDRRREEQQVRWMWQLVRDELDHRLRTHPAVAALVPELEAGVLDGGLPPARAAARLVAAFTAGLSGERDRAP
ncbi:methylmalonyl Co-A mutase-associated GTPase MeaB [Modestobacter sp. VKM Ac-2986]|uniref:methylmalonyl Co-A mutase-associated GTPase MeaB n=1 Tax=Modestobacter sp. VKM Ac-2986 TaxID=3004140 RepID=UPI0022AB954F|nr:methylmalonyl Co-A mutase-associated GTPase MeaB [Modestobacter sp. VKM Ac-2986]MCZ2829777.1 methylmalonyl Co-A mutase-associated GTPase MeaB [Modestobacter sp. VKM Ac-2986]